jgi:hypothetical protein
MHIIPTSEGIPEVGSVDRRTALPDGKACTHQFCRFGSGQRK